MPKILHAADFHLDSPFAGLPPEKARQRRRESRDLLGRMAELVEQEGVELVLLSGDLFDGERVYPETLEALGAALSAMGCPVCIAPGNHDPYVASSPYARWDWPENVHIFRREELETIAFPLLGCAVHGAAFTAQERQDPVLSGFTAPDDGLTHLLCLHGDAGASDSRYGPIPSEQLSASGVDYAALGHIHQCSGLQCQGGVFWAYPGCPEGRGFDELGDKGVLVGQVERGSAQLHFVPLCRRRYRILRLDVTGAQARRVLEDHLPDTAAEDVCRVILTGETGAEGIDLAALETAFAPRFYALQLRDETRAAECIWARAGEDSLRGLFLSRLRERYDQAGDEKERQRVEQAVRFGLAALDGRDLG